MKYLLMIHTNEKEWGAVPEAQRQQLYGEYRQLIEELRGKGTYLAGSQLQPTSTSTSVRVREGRRLVTDGPFAEVREQLGGYFLIEAANLDEAIGIAARIPSARTGTIEVRPIIEAMAPAGAG